MPPIEILITFSIAAFILNISPGPSSLYVIARSISQGSKAGIIAALGLGTGSMVHVLAAILGLAAIFEKSPALYTTIKLIGAAYLIYLGINYWRSAKTNGQAVIMNTPSKSLWMIFRESIIVEITNPKTALFFVALLPQFVVPDAAPVAQQLFILGLIVTLSAIPCDMLIAIFASKAANWLLQNKQAQYIQERVSGSILFSMGIFIFSKEATQ